MKRKAVHEIFVRETGRFDREVITYPNGATMTLFRPSRRAERHVERLKFEFIQIGGDAGKLQKEISAKVRRLSEMFR